MPVRLLIGFCIVAGAVSVQTLASPVAMSSATSGQATQYPEGSASDERTASDDGRAVDEAATALQSWIVDTGWPYYSSMSVDYARNAVTVYATRDLPTGILDKVAAISPTVNVGHATSKYTSEEMGQEAQRLLRSAAATKLAYVGSDRFGNGVTIAPISAGTDLKALNPGLPLIIREPAGLYRSTSRNNGSPAGVGGALMHRGSTTSASICSAGLSVFYGSAPNRRYGMLTAKHCGENYYYGSAGTYFGRTHILGASEDLQMLIGSTQDYRPENWINGWSSSTRGAVVNGGNPAVGSLTWLSGGTSGDNKVKVTDIDVYVNLNGTVTGPGFLFQDENANGAPHCAIQGGDSGSPLVNGSNTAQGLAVGGFTQAYNDCPHPQGGLSYVTGFAARISSALAAFDPDLGLVTTVSGGGH